MTQKDEALQILKDYNAWRRGNDCDLDTTLPMPNPKNVGMAIDFAISALSEPETVTLPDGWVAVPAEPTADMLKSTLEVHCRSIDNFSWTAMYKAMLQAAPTLNEKG